MITVDLVESLEPSMHTCTCIVYRRGSAYRSYIHVHINLQSIPENMHIHCGVEVSICLFWNKNFTRGQNPEIIVEFKVQVFDLKCPLDRIRFGL